MSILVTGIAGFIGAHLAKRLLTLGHMVIGVDNLNEYYDIRLKQDRLAMIEQEAHPGCFTFVHGDLQNREMLEQVWSLHRPSLVVHLAAQAGVRYSLENPQAYIDSNITGFLNVLEMCRTYPVEHLVYASSSSVYGANGRIPFSTADPVDHPVSLYAATKKSNELMAHTYSHLFGVPTTGLRFFTVYGPWGRPDMAYYSFTRDILNGTPIRVFNNGEMERDFTYIDDIIEGMVRLLDKPPQADPGWDRIKADPATSYAPYRIYNIGNHRPVKLMYFIRSLEGLLNKKAKVELLPMQPGDVEATYADITDLERISGFKPATSIEEGLSRFVEWYRSYYQV